MVISEADALAFADALVFFPQEAEAPACAVASLALADKGPSLALSCANVALFDAEAEWLEVTQL